MNCVVMKQGRRRVMIVSIVVQGLLRLKGTSQHTTKNVNKILIEEIQCSVQFVGKKIGTLYLT